MQVKDTLTLAFDLSSRDASLVAFLFEELADTIEAPEGAGVHPEVSVAIQDRFAPMFEAAFGADRQPGVEGVLAIEHELNNGGGGGDGSGGSSSSSSGLIPVRLWGDLDLMVQEESLYFKILPMAVNNAEPLKYLSSIVRLMAAW